MSCLEAGFRLAGPPSECSLRSKARIDALFEDSRSICSSTFGGWYGEVSTVASANPEDVGAEEQKRVNSAVQARIEAMFASVEAESGTPGECAAAILPVKYMGAAPVGGRVASVRGLQEPLRQLVERMERSVRAELEVSRRGLTFRTSEICEKNNPFRRIAVWSALKLRCRRTASGEFHHAFLPLVGEQEQGQSSEDKHADLYRTMRGLSTETGIYPPIFAVVMRRPGATRMLECHGFTCQSEEDAVAAAATLYRALLSDLDANRRRPRQANGLGCVSLASVASSICESSVNNRLDFRSGPLRPPAPRPVRPPRTKKHANSASASNDESSKSADVDGQRRRKKNSDVKAEDILEARGRRHQSSQPERNGSVATNLPDSGKRKPTADPPTKQDWQNLRNKEKNDEIYKDTIVGPGGKSSEDLIRSEIIYEKPKNAEDEIYDRYSNLYEKVSIKGKRMGFSSTERLEILNGKDEPIEKKECEIYEKNHGSYDLNGNESKMKESSGRESYSLKSEVAVELYDRINKNPIYQPISNMSTRGKIYEDHFKDVDKIYSLGEDEPKNEKQNSRNNSLNSQESVYYAKSKKNTPRQNREDQALREPESTHSRRRVSRVETMDLPLKKPSSNERVSRLTESSEPRVRKRTRAGSEPPVSRSEEAAKARQETRLKRSQSDLEVDRGDLLTRVELPRRGSFLTSGSTRRPNNVKGGTPLGFTELFDEFRNQEGLTSVDDILAAIIDPEGMSFNDLKPLYKEFLLKLAATLTQDELYQRSASIMRRRRRPQRRRSVRRPCLLGRAIKRSVSRLKGGPTEFTSVIFPARRLNDSFGSSSSCDAKNAQRNRVLASRLGRRRSSWKLNKNGHCHTTSEDSDTCRRLGRNQVVTTANRSSSGYVSCSECSYDSESCTCVSADKCYCSLSRRVPVQQIHPNTMMCSCDTDSCSESNKCYCARRPVPSTILEQLRQRGIVPSESTLSRGGSPERMRNSKTNRGYASSRSLEYLKIQPSPACGSSDNLALDYDLFSPGRKSQQSSSSEKVLVVSARDTQGRLVYVGGADRDKKSFPRGNGRPGAHHEALSIKKSAEIAAVFGADSNRIYRRASNASSIRSSLSLEAGLGYLP